MSPQQIMFAVLAAGALALGTYFYGRHDGRALERAEWVVRDNEALRKANAAIDAAQRRARELEQKHAAEQAQIVVVYEKELNHVENERDGALAAVRRGDLRLRERAAAPCAAGGDRPAETAASAAGGVPATAPSELPGARDEAVIRLLSEADEVVKELNLCWAVVRADRQ